MKPLKHKLLILGVLSLLCLPFMPSGGTTSARCVEENGDPCSTNELSPAAERKCRTDWDKKSVGSSTGPNAYQASKCDESKGGPCKVATSTEGGVVDHVIICKRAPTTADGPSGPTDLGSSTFNSQTCPSGQQLYDTGEGKTCCPTSVPTSPKNKVASACVFAKYVNPVVTLLSALVGIVVVIAIIVGAIQYSSAAGDPGKTAAAKERIRNAIIALIAYVFLFSFIQWLIPGGIL